MDDARALLTVLCLAILVTIEAFNVDTEFPVTYQRERNTYFGFSVALLRNNFGPIALVAAPRANSSYFSQQTKESGALFSCQISDSIARPNCYEMDLNKSGAVFTGYKTFPSEGRKDNMWLGVSLDVQHVLKEDNIVVCGHLWKSEQYDANGVCYVINSDLDSNSVKKLLPFVDLEKQSKSPPGVPFFAYGQVGCSATFSENGSHLLLGAPGFFNWTGTVLKYGKKPNAEALELDTSTVVPKDPRKEGLLYSSYIGYATSSGRFFRSESLFLATGAPRDGDGRGQVYLVEISNEKNKEFVIYDRKRGTQFGEYFGASVLGVNLNGDEFTDLLVGAPFSTVGSGADEGKVYVYLSDGEQLRHFADLEGEKRNSRFGSSIAGIGDINQDGFKDVAIGAPYEEGSGAIYIYHGTSFGLDTTHIQKILASEIHSRLKGFGISISRGLDIDSNYYPDILVGSYHSANAVLFRTHPVIQVNGSIHFSPQQINVDVTPCTLGGEKVSCINVTSCFRYSGRHVETSLEFSTELLIDWERMESSGIPRGSTSFEGDSSSRVERRLTATVDVDACFEDDVIIPKNINDLTTPMLFVFRVELVRNGKGNFCKTCPLVDPKSPTLFNESIPFVRGCGQDNICSSDLVVEAQLLTSQRDEPLIVGENRILTLDVSVTNRGESAYSSVLYIRLPDATSIVKQNFCEILPDHERQKSDADLRCLLPNPLEINRKVFIEIKFDISNLPTSTEVLHIHLEAKTKSIEKNPINNKVDIFHPVIAIADISITGSSEEEQIVYTGPKTEEEMVEISHTYFIKNKGPSPVQVIDIEIRIPTSIYGVKGLVEFLSFTDLKIENDQNMYASCNTSIKMKTSKLQEWESENRTLERNDSVVYEGNRGATSNPKDSFPATRPKKRSGESKETRSMIKAKDVILNCETARCTTIQCTASPFSEIKNFAQFKIKAVIDIAIIEEALPDPWSKIEFFTYGRISVRENRVNTKTENSLKTSVKTVVLYPGILASEVASWIIYVSVGVGILLLLIILFIFMKIGFFKRQEKQKMEEMMNQDEPQEMEENLVSEVFKDNEYYVENENIHLEFDNS